MDADTLADRLLSDVRRGEGIVIGPYSEIKSGAVPGAFLVTFRDPDNTQLEVFAPPRR